MTLIPDIAQAHLSSYCLLINKRLKSILAPNEKYFAKGNEVPIHSDLKLLQNIQNILK